MTFNTIVMADLIRHLESRFRVKPGMTQEGEAGMTKEGYARFRLGGRNDV